ncbi:MAG: hypothetical protein HXS48_16900 [Theionarchaea archaeon]|nr:MAG: hypothetical protein AYK19_15725 [Theionarchaea archaeon DG-70-1]MBU7028616.1 hypothetical protein [Theionarchaea archaeon]
MNDPENEKTEKEEHPEFRDILPREKARREWEDLLPENLEFDKDVDLDQIAKMYPLTKTEIQGAIERAYKLSRGERVGEALRGKAAPVSEPITLNSRRIREGIVWALGDKVLLERCETTKRERCCPLQYYCMDPSHKDDFNCWVQKKYGAPANSFCNPADSGEGFMCPKERRFVCELFRCYGSGKGEFVFECWDGGEMKFECVRGPGKGDPFSCHYVDSRGETFECWAGKYFECKPVKGKKDTFTCMPKKKEFKCPEKVKFVYKCMEKKKVECVEQGKYGSEIKPVL